MDHYPSYLAAMHHCYCTYAENRIGRVYHPTPDLATAETCNGWHNEVTRRADMCHAARGGLHAASRPPNMTSTRSFNKESAAAW